MGNEYWLRRKRAAISSKNDLPIISSPYRLIVRSAVMLCTGAVSVVAFNIFASSQQNENVLVWSLMITVTFTLFGGAFVLWAASILWPKADIRATAGGTLSSG